MAAELGNCAPSAQPFRYDADLLFTSRVLFAPTPLESDAEAQLIKVGPAKGLDKKQIAPPCRGSGIGWSRRGRR